MPPKFQQMQEMMQQMMIASAGTDLIYSFVIIVVSLMVFFGTKQLYALTSHKGIKYFRLSFLFFAIAYFFRSFIRFFLVFMTSNDIIIPREFLMLLSPITLFLFMYFSVMAVFYLLFSVICKKWDGKSKTIIFHIVAIITSIVITISTNPLLVLAVNLFLFLLVLIVFIIAFVESSKNKKKNSLFIIYFLLLIFWLLNIIDIFIPTAIQAYQLLIYLASTGIFLAILYKVLKKAGI